MKYCCLYFVLHTGAKLNVFNSQEKIIIGGGNSKLPFIGNITGLVFNGISVMSHVDRTPENGVPGSSVTGTSTW